MTSPTVYEPLALSEVTLVTVGTTVSTVNARLSALATTVTGHATVSVGARVQPEAPERVILVTAPPLTFAVAVGRVVHSHPVTITVGAEV